MAYKQKPGRGDGPKTGAGVESITSSIQGTNPFSEAVAKSKTGFGKITAPKVGATVKDEMAYKNASFEDRASFDRASKSNSLVGGTLKDAQASYSFGKGSAKASESSAEAMTLKQNENQLPGGKGFKGATSFGSIMPNMKPDSPDGTVKEYRKSAIPSFKMGVSYNSSNKSPGNLGKLETLATKETYDNGKLLKMDNVIKESFGAADKFNEAMGGTQNPARASRDLGYGRSTDDRKNVFKGATDPSGNAKIDRQITKEIKRSAESGNLRNQPIYAQYQPGNGSYHLKEGNLENLIGIANASGQRGESAMTELTKIVNRNKPRAEQGGFESTYKQKYEYPTDVTYDASSDKYSGPTKGKTYMSPESTMNQNIMTSKAADAKMNFSQYNAKRKANLGLK
jgi:hypothetical protein